MGDPDWVARSWLQPSPGPAFEGIWGVNQQTEELSLFLCFPNNFNNDDDDEKHGKLKLQCNISVGIC